MVEDAESERVSRPEKREEDIIPCLRLIPSSSSRMNEYDTPEAFDNLYRFTFALLISSFSRFPKSISHPP